jgi:hypothetical protein
MINFTEEEQELIKVLGKEAFFFLLRAWKTSKANGVDLSALLDKASDLNALDIDQIEV